MIHNLLILLKSPSMKWCRLKRKLELVGILSLLVLSLLSYCKCQKEVCGTKASTAIDVMWMIHTNNDIKRSDFLILKQFLSDMMLWFRISSSNIYETRHGCLIYSDIVQEVSQFEISVKKAQKNIMDIKHENTTEKRLVQVLHYLSKNSVDLDRPTVPNVVVVVTAGQVSLTSNTTTAATELTKAGWNIIFLVVPPKVDSDKIQRFSSEPHHNYYTVVGSFTELNSLDFQEQVAKTVCGYNNSIIDEPKVRTKRNSDTKLGRFNAAEGKPSIQSSTYVPASNSSNYSASVAVDGISFRGICSRTMPGNEKNWWEVDLLNNYDVEYVTILNTIIDDRHKRQKLFEIIGHNGVVNNVQVTPELCASKDNTSLGVSERFNCLEILEQKRYVLIWQSEVFQDNDLNLCEVEVWTAWPPGYVNVALSKMTIESSTTSGSSDLAVDGDTSDLATAGSCSSTSANRDMIEWWQVDLKKPVDILGVTIFNRQNFYERLQYFDVWAYKEQRDYEKVGIQLCGSVHQNFFFSIRHFDCELLKKRYVLIKQYKFFKDNFLALCEVEVWTDCEVGTYGRNCKKKCENCGADGACDKVTGACLTAINNNPELHISDTGVVAGVVTIVVLLASAGGVLFGLLYRRNFLKHHPDPPNTINTTELNEVVSRKIIEANKRLSSGSDSSKVSQKS